MVASTAFVPEALMPDWLRVVNDFNPNSYLIEAIRALMTTGFDWSAKVLVINREIVPGRIIIVLVDEVLGF